MKTLRLFFHLGREEKWLNEMAGNGWELCGKSFRYNFQKVAGSIATIKIDYRSFKTKRDFQGYVTLFEDSGWQHIAGSKNSGKQYFKRISGAATPDIFSDHSSKAARYKRMSNIFSSLASVYVVLFFTLSTSTSLKIAKIWRPKSWYYTPGLWDLSGRAFWKSFLFETPFALLRGLGLLLFLSTLVLLLIFAIVAELRYRRIASKQR